MLVNNEIPKNRYDPIYHYSKLNFRGMSYLLHPDVLLYNAYKHTSKDVAIYAGLASLRPFANYIVNHTRTLPIRLCPKGVREEMEDESLIILGEDDELHFLYEDPDSSLIH